MTSSLSGVDPRGSAVRRRGGTPDEAHTYFVEVKGSDAESKRLTALASENRRLVEDLVKKGRSLGFLTILATQKSTGDSIPTSIRDVCPVLMSFAQTTAAAAVAALGEVVRDYPEADPVALQGPEFVGVASMKVEAARDSPGSACPT